jgi:hypothetical protein
MKYRIYVREQHEVNTDPQRRCYNGCHYSSEMVWSAWTHLGTVFSQKDAEESVAFWRKIGRKTSEYKYELAPTEPDKPTEEPSNACHQC